MSPRHALAAKRYISNGGMQPTNESSTNLTVAPHATTRRLPATTLPEYRESRRGWGLLSALLHVLVIALLITPFATHTGDVTEKPQGAGGPGPAGGGGGGKQGTGGAEHVRYVRVEPAPAPAPKAVTPPPVPPKPQPKPIVPPPPVKPPEQVAEQKPEAKPEVTKLATTDVAATPGVGGGTGRDGSTGTGPGSGGGVGSGIGPGRGSGIGPGTGGGTQANFPPTPTELFIPPLPMPDKVRGFHLIAEYDVDSTGKVIDFKFTPTRDGGYNRRLEEVLKSFKFRPGTTPAGVPIRMKAQIIYDF